MTPSSLKAQVLCILVLLLHAGASQAQGLTQRIRGSVTDQILTRPLAGATVTLLGEGGHEERSTVTDSNGNFFFRDVPIGRRQLRISHIGFKESTLDNILVEAGKESVLNIPLETAAHTENEVVVKAGSRRNRPLNEMSVVSSRAFTVEETQKFPAAVNDPLRMATSFAGVIAPFDGNNDIVIRGNSPTGLLWRMEGVDIPNPNHFSSAASSGGGISILSAQLLSNSDFLTGAFPAEYGDALSGVFDLHLRKGNNEKREYTLQAGVLGLDVSAEGPLSAFYKGSFLVNYRYSTLALLKKIGLDIGSGVPVFQDLSYNIYMPTRKWGEFSLFGFAGLSSQKGTPKKDSAKWKEEDDRYAQTYSGTTAMTGLTHNIFLGSRTNLRSVLSVSYTGSKIAVDYMDDNYQYSRSYTSNDKTPKWTLTSTLNHRFGTSNTFRAGAIVNLIGFNYYQEGRKSPEAPLLKEVDASGHTQTIQAFAQWQGRPADHLLFNAGVHYLELLLNHSRAIEPRASVKWEIDGNNSIGLGVGLHSQIQALGVYFAQDTMAGGQYYRPNSNLGLTHAQHYVLSYNHRLGADLNLKAELYYQRLYNVPVNANDTNTFSTLNIESSDYVSDPLVNKGKGRNYGVELSLEKFLSHRLYYIVNTSLYESKYTALDGIERNTRFNGHYLVNFVAGKEFIWSQRADRSKIFGVNIKTIYAGGFRTTPIDAVQSMLQNQTIIYQKEAYTLSNPAYFRTDLRLSLKKERRHLTTILSLDLQNLTGRRNVYDQQYDIVKKKVVTIYQVGLIPVLNYKVEF